MEEGRTRLAQAVQHPHFVACRQQLLHEDAADVSGAPGHEHPQLYTANRATAWFSRYHEAVLSSPSRSPTSARNPSSRSAFVTSNRRRGCPSGWLSSQTIRALKRVPSASVSATGLLPGFPP